MCIITCAPYRTTNTPTIYSTHYTTHSSYSYRTIYTATASKRSSAPFRRPEFRPHRYVIAYIYINRAIYTYTHIYIYLQVI